MCSPPICSLYLLADHPDDSPTGIHILKHTASPTNKQTYRHTDIQTDRQTDRQTHRQARQNEHANLEVEVLPARNISIGKATDATTDMFPDIPEHVKRNCFAKLTNDFLTPCNSINCKFETMSKHMSELMKLHASQRKLAAKIESGLDNSRHFYILPVSLLVLENTGVSGTTDMTRFKRCLLR